MDKPEWKLAIIVSTSTRWVSVLLIRMAISDAFRNSAQTSQELYQKEENLQKIPANIQGPMTRDGPEWTCNDLGG